MQIRNQRRYVDKNQINALFVLPFNLPTGLAFKYETVQAEILASVFTVKF
jgi:hypothetical protein